MYFNCDERGLYANRRARKQNREGHGIACVWCVVLKKKGAEEYNKKAPNNQGRVGRNKKYGSKLLILSVFVGWAER